ncbi:MAG: RIP metalloprotease RseP [Pseudomonadota bacterium]
MDLINSIPLIGPVLAVVLPFLVVLSVVVAIHELGHLMVGRWCGIKAEVYSIGFGKVLWSRVDKYGTRWQVAALPLGGFVKFVGDMDPASAGRVDDDDLSDHDRAHAFHNAALWRRTLTVLAGPVANFILSLVIFFGLALYSGKLSDDPVITEIGDANPVEIGFQPGDRVLSIADEPIETFGDIIDALSVSNGQPTPAVIVRDGQEMEITTQYILPPRVTDLVPDGAAANVGVQAGDLVHMIDGKRITSARDVSLIGKNLPPNQPIDFVFKREGELLEMTFTPKMIERPDPETGEITLLPTMGIGLGDIGGLRSEIVPVTLLEAAEYGIGQVWRIISTTVVFINEMIFNGADTSQLSGPIGIAKFSGDAAEEGAFALIRLVAFLSTAVGLFNLFPIPVLDGGHLMFYLCEALRGRPVGEAAMKYGTMLGLSLVLLLMVFVTYNDVMKL